MNIQQALIQIDKLLDDPDTPDWQIPALVKYADQLGAMLVAKSKEAASALNLIS
jgi:hypothetical protein